MDSPVGSGANRSTAKSLQGPVGKGVVLMSLGSGPTDQLAPIAGFTVFFGILLHPEPPYFAA